jgi:hypothetical protein
MHRREATAIMTAEPIPIEPLLLRHVDAARVLGLGQSRYYKLIREGRIQSVGKGRMSRAVYSSIRKYVSDLVAEAEAPKAA